MTDASPFNAPVLTVSGLNYQYPSQRRGDNTLFDVRDAAFEASSGEITCIVGPSGSGKSTLLKLVSGELPAAAGRILLGEACLSQVPFGCRHTATVRQDHALIPELTVAQNVALAERVAHGSVNVETRIRLQRLLQSLGIARLADRPLRELSGGERQRTAIARALIVQPAILMLDEPTSGLDMISTAQLARELLRIRDIRPAPVILVVSHDRDFCLRVADRLVIVDAGRTLWSGAPANVFVAPQTGRVYEILGLAILLHGSISNGQFVAPSLRPDTRDLELPLSQFNVTAPTYGAATIMAPRHCVHVRPRNPESSDTGVGVLRLSATARRHRLNAAGQPEVDVELENGVTLDGIWEESVGIGLSTENEKVWVELTDIRVLNA